MLSASLIFLFGIGAIVSPVIASYIIEHFGPLSMFTYFAAMPIFARLYRLSCPYPAIKCTASFLYIYSPHFVIYRQNH